LLLAQPFTPQYKVYHGFINNDITTWTQGVEELAQSYRKTGDATTLLQLASGTYGLVGVCIAQKCGREEALIAQAEGYLNDLLKRFPGSAQALATQGGLYGIKIALNRATAVYYGPKSLAALDASLKNDPNCPYGWVEKGNAKYHSPAIVGGDYKEAVRCFAKAAALFEAKPAEAKHNWLYLHSLVWLGKSYEKTGQNQAARDTYRKILAIEPGFLWVKNELLPAMEKKSCAIRPNG